MDTSWTAGPLYSLAALVAVAGIVKLGRPASALAALRAARLPAPHVAVRALGLAEILVAAFVIAVGSRQSAMLLAASYAGFAAFSARLLVVQGGTAPCGCFGESSTPTSPLHVAVNAVGTVLALIGVAWPPLGLTASIAGQDALGLPFLAAVATATWAWFALLVLLPDLIDGIRLVAADGASAEGAA